MEYMGSIREFLMEISEYYLGLGFKWVLIALVAAVAAGAVLLAMRKPVGQIKILASENYKGGVRLSVVCGARALAAAQAMRARQAEIGALLSAKADQTAVAVHRVYDEYTALKVGPLRKHLCTHQGPPVIPRPHLHQRTEHNKKDKDKGKK